MFKNEKRPRVNESITAPNVLLIDEQGQPEEIPREEALRRAREQELDLIEVSPKAKPPVVKIGDYGNFLYQLQKKEKRQRAHSKATEVKMLRFSFRTDTHDLERIMDRAREFLGEHHMVKLAVRLRGREMTNKEFAANKLRNLLTRMGDVAEVEQEVKMQGNQFIAVIRPKR
ncbi:translation initiation factor IF-3 [Candidatus Peregrinibacteria bacterium CG10_big_fil_rev_8_21_14_0_10_49_16]|nr:MAG: translation initiation factor IF-3 [Candidatus Peregrinibacteria bacterium CG22_combo_CG10-13_8_21_14_all_49_11]PIR51738.1 MAG: translation initiation factor IF-3 [Candidatus Peregrinibacteria bacterium CG10_big_fil_rev_8_21_14_0_10_49_16]